MTFLSPIWLLALLPWGAVVVWVLRGRGRAEVVPFLALWRGPVKGEPVERRWRRPAVGVLAVLAAALAAILAAAGPIVSGWGGQPPPLTVIVDRGITMSGATPDRPVFREWGAQLGERLAATPGWIVTLRFVPPMDERSVRADQSLDSLESVPPTAMDTKAALAAAVRDALARDAGPVAVISDQPLPDSSDRPDTSDRLVQIAPSPGAANIGISALAARTRPHPQLMVRLTGSAPGGEVELAITSGGQTIQHAVRWVADDPEQTVFVDLPSAGEWIDVHLNHRDAIAADNRAWLVRSQDDVRFESRVPLPQEIARVLAAFARVRATGGDADISASAVAIVGDEEQVGPGDRAIILPTAPAETLLWDGALSVVDHALTAHVDWTRLATAARGVRAPASFSPLVTIGDVPVVAVRENPARQVWVGLDAPGWARSADFVIFWTNVFSWLTGEPSQYRAQAVGSLPHAERIAGDAPDPAPAPGLWPGVYRREDGMIVAVNPPRATPGLSDATSSQVRWEHLEGRTESDRSIAGLLAIAALVCLVFAATVWPDTT